MPVKSFAWSTVAVMMLVAPTLATAKEPALKAMIVDGQNNHDWQATTPLLKKHLEDSKLFTVDVATSPPKGADLSGFKPVFSAYNVVVLNYNGQEWCDDAKKAFVDYVREGGGVVVVHAADNAFSRWPEYNQIIGLGGWGGRDEASGPYIRFRDSGIVRDTQPGRGGEHGPQHPYLIAIRDETHPITIGLPLEWMHAKDELYAKLRGPALNIHVLGTAFSAPDMRGTNEHEPCLFTVEFGAGRTFHTTLGHSPDAMRCVGFIFTYQRGAEWAATGQVTQVAVPPDFPTAQQVSQR
ncbi:MAG TPA: ThuA domain-containing protein [Pirellulales bacterium]|nr:ThuA domain-containing protein [Pirellulales bacterium]